jgi:hypothetical protein
MRESGDSMNPARFSEAGTGHHQSNQMFGLGTTIVRGNSASAMDIRTTAARVAMRPCGASAEAWGAFAVSVFEKYNTRPDFNELTSALLGGAFTNRPNSTKVPKVARF